jgi:HAD superfamily phosphatase (TIGR01668 family)
MLKKFFPKLIIKKYQDIDIKFLNERNIRGLILDIDNTLVPYSTEEPDDELIEWLEDLKKNGIKICIISNANEQRVKVFNEKLDLVAIAKAGKPKLAPFNKGIRVLNLQPYEIAMLGDQVFTDIYGGNRANLYTILVERITPKELIFIKFKRIFEKIVINSYRKSIRRGIKG